MDPLVSCLMSIQFEATGITISFVRREKCFQRSTTIIIFCSMKTKIFVWLHPEVARYRWMKSPVDTIAALYRRSISIDTGIASQDKSWSPKPNNRQNSVCVRVDPCARFHFSSGGAAVAVIVVVVGGGGVVVATGLNLLLWSSSGWQHTFSWTPFLCALPLCLCISLFLSPIFVLRNHFFPTFSFLFLQNVLNSVGTSLTKRGPLSEVALPGWFTEF